MTLKELLEKLPPEVKETVMAKIYEEKLNHKIIAELVLDLPNVWTKEGYYPDKQDIDF